MVGVIDWQLLSLNKILPKSVFLKSEDPMSHFLNPFTKGSRRQYYIHYHSESHLVIVYAYVSLSHGRKKTIVHNIDVPLGFCVQTRPIINVCGFCELPTILHHISLESFHFKFNLMEFFCKCQKTYS